MSESSRAQAGPDRQASQDHLADGDLGLRIAAPAPLPAPLKEPDLALLPRIASQLALLNLMGGSSSQARRARPVRGGSLVRPTMTGSHSIRCYR